MLKCAKTKLFWWPTCAAALATILTFVAIASIYGLDVTIPSATTQETVTTGDLLAVIIVVTGITAPIIIAYLGTRERDIQSEIRAHAIDAMQIRRVEMKDLAPARAHWVAHLDALRETGLIAERNENIIAIDALEEVLKLTATYDPETQSYKPLSQPTLQVLFHKSRIGLSRNYVDLFEKEYDRQALRAILIILAILASLAFAMLFVRYLQPSLSRFSVYELSLIVGVATLNTATYVLLAHCSSQKAQIRRVLDATLARVSDHTLSVVALHKEYIRQRDTESQKLLEPPSSPAPSQ